MALVCSISSEVPETPVVSPASGCVFERRLIVAYIAENGTDPVNGAALKEEELIALKTPASVKPRPPTASSIPAILKTLQDEWDACMLNNFSMRQQLQTARQELSHALYQHDAACRVIARLTKEVTAAREALATLKPHAALPTPAPPTAAPDASEPMDAEPTGITDDVIKKLTEKAGVLTAQRKARGKGGREGLCPPEDVKEWTESGAQVGLHSASTPGLVSLDIAAHDDAFLITGGNDKTACVFNRVQEKVVAVLSGHTKKVSSVIYHPTEHLAVTASPDSTVRIWPDLQSGKPEAIVLKAHSGPVNDISLHATGDFLLSVSADERWAFSDIRAGRVLCRVSDSAAPKGMSCGRFHPDGLIFGVGTADAMVKIWDLKEQSNVANFPGHTGPVHAISFSENGYYLATAAEDAQVKLWDLRKLKNFKSIALPDGFQVKDLCFDGSGHYLAVGGAEARVFQCKQWQELALLTPPPSDDGSPATVNGLRFGNNAAFLATATSTRHLRFYSKP